MHTDANGWPCIGKYIGKIDDYLRRGWLILNKPSRLNTKEWHFRRVYQDELDYYNNKGELK